MRILLALLILQLTVSVAMAEMYQWVAEDGSVTFKDTPPPASRKRSKVKVYKESDFAAAAHGDKDATKAAAQPVAPKKERFAGTVEIYVTDWCGYCKQALKYMNSKSIPYVAYNIEKDAAAKQRHKDLGGRGVPLIIIGSNKMSGFSPANLEYYLDNSR